MSVVRMNITLPEDLARKLSTLLGSKKKSQFIAEALEQRIENIEHEGLQKTLEEGYKSRKKESESFAQEFEPIDLEGLDEY